jgi:hypothetical protein
MRRRLPLAEIDRDNLAAILERPATLVLSPSEGYDGLLGPDEVEKIQSPTIVVLSACGAAKGPVRYGDDGVNHLGGAFFQTGAQTVLLTRAMLEIDSTAALTLLFLENLVQRGRSPARALLEARRRVAASPDWAHPFFHSILQVVGCGHRPSFEPLTDGTEMQGAGPQTESHALRGFLWLGVLLLGSGLLWLIWLRMRRG